MRFRLIDTVLETSAGPDGRAARAVALKHVSAAEEYLGDHFAGFPILPGVFMLEAMVQAAREIADARDPVGPPWVLGGARAVKFGRFVPPGCTLRVEVDLTDAAPDAMEFKGIGLVVDPGGGEPVTAVSGKFTLRRARVEPQPSA